MNTCAGCKFSTGGTYDVDKKKFTTKKIFCMRYPPTVTGAEKDYRVAYPVVNFDDWCGEYVSIKKWR